MESRIFQPKSLADSCVSLIQRETSIPFAKTSNSALNSESYYWAFTEFARNVKLSGHFFVDGDLFGWFDYNNYRPGCGPPFILTRMMKIIDVERILPTFEENEEEGIISLRFDDVNNPEWWCVFTINTNNLNNSTVVGRGIDGKCCRVEHQDGRISLKFKQSENRRTILQKNFSATLIID